MTADTSPLSILTTAAASAAMARGPALFSAAGFGPGEDPRPTLVWYALGALAFLAMLGRNLIGAWRDLRGKGAGSTDVKAVTTLLESAMKMLQSLDTRLSTLEAATSVPHDEHREDINTVHAKVESHRRELDQKIATQSATLTKVAEDIAASRAETRTLNTAVRQLMTLMTQKGPR